MRSWGHAGEIRSVVAREPAMRNKQNYQRDLFEEETARPDLRSDVREKLGPLLQLLLTEAASQEVPIRLNKLNSDGGTGDDQDHA